MSEEDAKLAHRRLLTLLTGQAAQAAHSRCVYGGFGNDLRAARGYASVRGGPLQRCLPGKRWIFVSPNQSISAFKLRWTIIS